MDDKEGVLPDFSKCSAVSKFSSSVIIVLFVSWYTLGVPNGHGSDVNFPNQIVVGLCIF